MKQLLCFFVLLLLASCENPESNLADQTGNSGLAKLGSITYAKHLSLLNNGVQAKLKKHGIYNSASY
jgi:hypothetical protein